MSKQLNKTDVSNDDLTDTITTSIYALLKDDIIAGKLKPGSKLRLQTLNEKYNVGNSPLREALNRLTANNMVSQQENKGFRVSAATLDELKDIVRTRCMLEEVALRRSIENNDESYYERIVLIAYRLSRMAQDSGSNCGASGQQDLHLEFHQAILSGCGSKLLIKYCLSLYEQTQRYCNLAIDQKCREDHEEKDHQAICDAIVDRDAVKAIELLRSHYQVTKDTIIKSDSLA